MSANMASAPTQPMGAMLSGRMRARPAWLGAGLMSSWQAGPEVLGARGPSPKDPAPDGTTYPLRIWVRVACVRLEGRCLVPRLRAPSEQQSALGLAGPHAERPGQTPDMEVECVALAECLPRREKGMGVFSTKKWHDLF